MDHRFCGGPEDLFPEIIFSPLCPPALCEENQKVSNVVEKLPTGIGN